MCNWLWHREFYDAGALMLNDEATVVAGLLVGLNIIDCNMVLKDDDDLDRPVHGIIHLVSLSQLFYFGTCYVQLHTGIGNGAVLYWSIDRLLISVFSYLFNFSCSFSLVDSNS